MMPTMPATARTVAGFRIPRSSGRTRPAAPCRRMHGAVLSALTGPGGQLAHLLDVRWQGDDRGRDVLDAAYRWADPQLPVSVASFEN